MFTMTQCVKITEILFISTKETAQLDFTAVLKWSLQSFQFFDIALRYS